MMNGKKTSSISTRKYLIWIILLAVIVRISLMIIFQSWEFGGAKKYGHRAGEIGSALALGHGFSWPKDSSYVPENSNKKTAWEAPVYPIIIATVFKAFGIYSRSSALVLIFFQTILSALCCLLLYSVGKRFFNGWVGLIAALIFALYPASIHFGIQKVQATYLIVLLLLLVLLQIDELSIRPTVKISFLTGATIGITVLTDPTIIAFLPFALIWLVFNSNKVNRSSITGIICIIIVLLSILLTNLPWLLRNYRTFGDFFLVKSNFTRELFIGNFRNKDSFSKEQEYMKSLNEGQRKKVYAKKALDSILKNPSIFAQRIMTRIHSYWFAITKKDIGMKANENKLERIVGVSYLFVIFFGMGGIIISIFKRKKVQLLLFAILSLPIPYYLTWFTRFRYRFPVETVIMIFTAYALYFIVLLLDRLYPQAKNYLFKFRASIS